jgi:hypothetical protein
MWSKFARTVHGIIWLAASKSWADEGVQRLRDDCSTAHCAQANDSFVLFELITYPCIVLKAHGNQ